MKHTRLRADLLAGLTTSFALVPECIAFALVAHLNPLMGLYGAFIICTLTALFGGRPGMISGASGACAPPPTRSPPSLPPPLTPEQRQ